MIIKTYLNSSKEDMYSKGVEHGLEDKALDKFMYALYEVEFDLEVNEETGEAKIIKVDGKEFKSE
jgi:hypothetical protein